MIIEVVTNSPDETVGLGKKMGEKLKGGEVFALRGNLGTGKTHFIKGLAIGCGVDESDVVNSPTFVLVNEYSGRLDIYHIDAYRLDSEKDFEALGFDDMISPGSVVVVEWADKVENIMRDVDCVDVSLSHVDELSRKIEFENLPENISL